LTTSNALVCEIAVVGSGPGGAITACLLAEAGRDVLLLEEGATLPVDTPEPYTLDEMTAKYRNGGLTVTLGAPKVAYVEGRVLGGGSEVNSGLYHRTPPDVLAAWRRDWRVEGLSEADLEPHFSACERAVSVSPAPGPPPAAALKMREGAQALDWASQEVPRWYRYDAAGAGARQSMSATFLPRAAAAGCRVQSGTRVLRLRREAGRWRLTARQADGTVLEVRAAHVFVAGGAVHTPALLRRSGVRRNVGNTLSLHPTVKVVAVFPDAVNGPEMGVPAEQVKQFAPTLSFGCSISTPPYLALAMTDHGAAATARVREGWRHMAIYYAMTPGRPVGRVRTLPRLADPLVRYPVSAEELRHLADGLGKLCRLLFAAGAESLYPSLAGGPALTEAGQVAALPAELPRGRTGLMTVHLFASCPMGEDERRCATDSFGRVHGADGLHVADASLFCGAPGVNPQGTVMVLAHRNALHFLEQG